MNNPCSECIVDAMCQESCDNLLFFLTIELEGRYPWPETVAKDFRKGKCEFKYLNHSILEIVEK